VVKKLSFLIILFFWLYSQEKDTFKIGLSLSGGAALGLAHIGVLKVLEREKIPIAFVTGNSMGSLVGGVYAAGYSAEQIESIALKVNWQELFSGDVPFGVQYLPERQLKSRYFLNFYHRHLLPYLPSGLISLQNVEFLLTKLLAPIEYNTAYDFDSLPIPYRAIAVNLRTGEKVALRKGRLTKAIRASIAIPGVFPPKVIDGEEYVDGGVKEYLPVSALLEFKPDFIIAVVTKKKAKEISGNLIDIVSRSIDIVTEEDLEKEKGLADILIEPDVERFAHSDFPKAKELIAVGESAALKVLPIIKEKLAGKNLVATKRPIRKRNLPIVRQIRYEGLSRTRPSLFQGRLKTVINKQLNWENLINDLLYLFHTNLFEEVDYRLELFGQESCAVIFELKEKPFGFYSLGIRYDLYDNVVFGGEIGENNIFGAGASLRTAFNLGNPNEIRFGLVGTRFLQFPFGYRLDGFYGTINRNYFKNNDWQGNYLLRYLGIISEIGYILGKNAFFNFGLKLEKNIYEIPFSDSFPKSEFTIGPTFKLEFNNYNNPFLPTKGTNLKINLLFSTKKLKATNNFLKWEFDYKKIIPFYNFLLFYYQLNLGFNFLKPNFAEYFYTGGEDFIGFKKEEFTTKNKGILAMGMDIKILNLFRSDNYPLYLSLTTNLANFLEAKKDFYWGAGIGLKTNTPVGPLRFMLGMGKIKAKRRFLFLTSIGQEFRYRK